MTLASGSCLKQRPEGYIPVEGKGGVLKKVINRVGMSRDSAALFLQVDHRWRCSDLG